MMPGDANGLYLANDFKCDFGITEKDREIKLLSNLIKIDVDGQVEN